ncbi:hypothetical protein EJ074_16455 [Mesorhizobium sp. M3A.F.Ca.ET.080.04.2.1]|nr:hypothetical protein EJ074_16455 [Mesorhizobium sp. M3A.F.Ca.ET.080.04.2.1]RWB84149.1 MAG: hypothetical protein EOQ52_24685 [Mesorhizobium sp.]
MSDDPEIQRPRQSQHDRNLLVQTRAAINRSRQLLIDTEPQRDPHRIQLDRNAVSITQVDDKWHVLVEQADQHMVTRSFRNEQYAVKFAKAKGCV